MPPTRRTSKKRQSIYDALCGTIAHPSAEQLYAQLKPEIPDLSLGTVYRNLNVLIEDGLITSVGNVKGEERYDANISEHSHFICTNCGKVFDVLLDLSVNSLYPVVEQRISGKVKGYSLNYFGLCEGCCK